MFCTCLQCYCPHLLIFFFLKLAYDHSLSVPGHLLRDSFLNINHYWNSNVYFWLVEVKKKGSLTMILWSNLSGLIERPGLFWHWPEEVTWVALFSMLLFQPTAMQQDLYLSECVESVELNLWLKNVSMKWALQLAKIISRNWCTNYGTGSIDEIVPYWSTKLWIAMKSSHTCSGW